MTTEERLAKLLSTSDEERRFKLITEFVKAQPTIAEAEGRRLLNAPDETARALGADLLGGVASLDQPGMSDIVGALLDGLASEDHAEVLAAIIVALGHTLDERARHAVLARAGHADAPVREAVAYALPALGLDDPALHALRELSRDVDDDVRDWATFALAESDADDRATVEALAARSDDPHYDTRSEAIFGLARRHDPRAKALVDRELANPSVGALIERARDELAG